MADDEPIARDAYDQLADSYVADVRENAYNAHMEFPATTELLPDVAGERVLDAGCGTGVYTEHLVEAGADVVGIDVSEAMLAHAREAVGESATVRQADLGEPLPFADDAFDGVVSALAIGYIADLDALFAEFARVLRPGGFLVVSTGHPQDTFAPEDGLGEVYYDVERVEKEWDVPVPYYRRPFQALVNPLLDAGFSLDRLVEPEPTEAFREQRPERYETESRHPVFVCLRATRE